VSAVVVVPVNSCVRTDPLCSNVDMDLVLSLCIMIEDENMI